MKTIVYRVENFSDNLDEKGEPMSQNDLDNLNKADVYNVRVGNMKKSVGLTTGELLLLVKSGDYKEIYVQEVYSRAKELTAKALQD